MKQIKIFIYIVFPLFCLTIYSQQNKNIKNKRIIHNIEKESKNIKLQEMIKSTAKVMFIDSIVVDKSEFIKHIPLTNEIGKMLPNNGFYKKNKCNSIFQNQLKNQRYISMSETDEEERIFVSDKLGEKWNRPHLINEIGEEYKSQIYPFMLSDGTTLFFAAKGQNSIGGYDIFMTRQDTETKQFYTPENFGMPYNSIFNDYMVAINDIDSIAWLVSDRYQPEGKVCIYTFIPSFPRKGFEEDNIDERQLEEYAKLTSIRKTWKFGDKKTAMARLMKILSKIEERTKNKNYKFIINDNIIYTKEENFKSKETKSLYSNLIKLYDNKNEIKKNILRNKDMLINFDKNIQNKYRKTILIYENKLFTLEESIKLLEKKIRNIENNSLKIYTNKNI